MINKKLDKTKENDIKRLYKKYKAGVDAVEEISKVIVSARKDLSLKSSVEKLQVQSESIKAFFQKNYKFKVDVDVE